VAQLQRESNKNVPKREFAGKCYGCGKEGHRRAQCPNQSQGQQ
jgi:hypothetical protein